MDNRGQLEKPLMAVGFVFIIIGGVLMTTMDSQWLSTTLVIIGICCAGVGKIMG